MSIIYVDPLNGTDNGDAGRGEDEGTDAYASIAYALANYGSFAAAAGNTIKLADTAADVLSSSIDTDTSVAAEVSPLCIEGYHYDGSNGGTAGALTRTQPFSRGTTAAGEIDGDDAVADIFDSNTGYTILKNLKLHSTTSFVLRLSAGSMVIDCEVYNGGATTISGTGSELITGCYIHTDTSGGVGLDQTDLCLYNEIKAHDSGIYTGSSMKSCMGNLVHGWADAGIYSEGDAVIISGNTIDGSDSGTGAYGIECVPARDLVSIYNNLITNVDGSGAKGIYSPTGASILIGGNNAFYNNSTDVDWDTPGCELTDITESSDPYTAIGSDDFSLDSGADSIGAAMISNADPDNPDNIGAWQDYSSGGGGGSGGETSHVFAC